MSAASPPAHGRVVQQFARFPEPGRVKTRLQPVLSAQQACAVHEELLLHTGRTLMTLSDAVVELWLNRIDPHPTIEAALAMGMRGPREQQGGDLGDRMGYALCDGLSRNGFVALVGSDCPALTPGYIDSAFAALDDSDVVLGPAEDGGFVLIACRRFYPDALRKVSWGGARVLEQSLQALARANLTATVLSPTLYDIDFPEDLERWRSEAGKGQARPNQAEDKPS